MAGGLLKASVGGAAALDVELGANSKLCVTVKLATMAISLDDRPLLQLLNLNRSSGELDRSLQPGAGFQFQLQVERMASPSPDVQVTLLGEPIQVTLAPRSCHGALRSAKEAFMAWRPVALELSEEQPQSTAMQNAKEAAEAAGFKSAKLRLRVEVEAPILRLEAYQDGAALEFHLGHFSGKSVPKDGLQQNRVVSLVDLIQVCESEAVDLQRFAVLCELRDTRINQIVVGEAERFAYEPSTIVLGAARSDEGGEIHVESTRVRCHLDPGLLCLLGHLSVGLDFALAPLSRELGRAADVSPRLVRSASRESSSEPWRFDLRTGSFDVIWDSKGEGNEVRGHIAGVNVQVLQKDGMQVVGSAQDANMACGDRKLLSSNGHLDLNVNWSSQCVHLALTAPPLELHWANESVKKAINAHVSMQHSFKEGQEDALQQCPPMECVTGVLWERFVAERKEQLRDAIGQAVKEIDPDEASIARRCVELSIKSKELRAKLVRPDGTEEVQATMGGLECELNSGEGGQCHHIAWKGYAPPHIALYIHISQVSPNLAGSDPVWYD